MLRDTRLIVANIEERFDIMVPNEFIGCNLYYTSKPYQDDEVFLCKLKGNETIISNPAKNERIYFVLETGEGEKITAAARLAGLGEVENFRDLGGYKTKDNKTVKWGRFFRGGALYNLSEDGKVYINNMGFKNIVDFRDDREIEKQPDYVPEETIYKNLEAVRLPVPTDNNTAVYTMEDRLKNIKTKEDADKFFQVNEIIYQSVPFKNPSYRELLEMLDSEEAFPMYQHCSAGKDRTGIGSALILLSLGVDRETVMGDYLLSATYRETTNRVYIDKLKEKTSNPVVIELANRLLSVDRTLLQETYDAIDEKYSSFGEFLKEEYGITKERRESWKKLHLI